VGTVIDALKVTIRGADRAMDLSVRSVNAHGAAAIAPGALHWTRFSIALPLHCRIALPQTSMVEPKTRVSARQGNRKVAVAAHGSIYFESFAPAAKCHSRGGMTLALPWSMTLPQTRMVEPKTVDSVKEGNRTLRDKGNINRKYIISTYIRKRIHLRPFTLRGVQSARA